VLNTRYEGLSHVMLEAMAAGVPVVASAVGGNPEVIDHERNGLLVALDDGDAIVKSVERLLADGEFVSGLRSEARRDVAAYRWDELVERTASTLEALGKRTSPSAARRFPPLPMEEAARRAGEGRSGPPLAAAALTPTLSQGEREPRTTGGGNLTA
jgi:hypothetical protein